MPPSTEQPAHDLSPTPEPQKSRKFFWVVLVVALLLLICAVIAWTLRTPISDFFASKSSHSSKCAEIADLSLEELAYANSVPTKRDISKNTKTFSFQERITASDISFKVPFNNRPEFFGTSSAVRVQSGEMSLFAVEGGSIGEMKEIANTTTCTELKNEFKMWVEGKTDLQITRDLLYLTPADQNEMSHDLLLVLLALKNLMHVDKDAYEMNVDGFTIFQFGPLEGNGRVDIYDEEGRERSNIVFRGMTQEEVDYVLGSLQ